MSHTFIKLLIIMLGCLHLAATKQRFTQLNFTFPSSREFKDFYNKEDNSLTLEFLNTTPSELGDLDFYDESLIKRIVVKDLTPRGVEVRLVFRDRDVRATITQENEPFRVLIDLFDKNFTQARDPETNLPRTMSTAIPVTNSNDQIHKDVTPSPSSKVSRKLLQDIPQTIDSPNELSAAVEKIDPGIGTKWRDYPPYIHRFQTDVSTKENDVHAKKVKPTTLSSVQAMADFAGDLFDRGHERRALFAYQQVLLKDPKIFDRSAEHLWKFAEANFGQGSLTLADGYYEALISRHGGHPAAAWARVRRMDIQAISAIRNSNVAVFPSLAKAAEAMSGRGNTDLQRQLDVRAAFWSNIQNEVQLTDANFIPQLQEPKLSSLLKNSQDCVGQRVCFLAHTIVLSSYLTPQQNWNKEHSRVATEYFQRYSGASTEMLSKELGKKLVTHYEVDVARKLNEGQYMAIIESYDAFGKNLQTMVGESALVNWSLGESQRNLGFGERSIPFYNKAATLTKNKVDSFKAYFWLALNAGEARAQLKNASQNPARIALLGDLIRASDENMLKIWGNFAPDERNELLTSFRSSLSDSLDGDLLLRAPAVAILSLYSPKKSSDQASSTIVQNNEPLTPASVFTLAKLAKVFSGLGMRAERAQATELLKSISPEALKDNETARRLWANELLALANEYRQRDNLLESGRLYAFVGENSGQITQRAESLYKAALLLFRAGRRDEAIAHFKACSEDTNNRYYANLCLERLDKLNN